MSTRTLSSVLSPVAGSTIARGRIVAVSPAGDLLVEDEDGKSSACDFLRTSSAPPPPVREGDEVLYVRGEGQSRGCVLGIVEPYVVEPIPQRVQIEATERVELRCGPTSLTMTGDGRVVLRGEQVVSRASGLNKIKGAAVKIN